MNNSLFTFLIKHDPENAKNVSFVYLYHFSECYVGDWNV